MAGAYGDGLSRRALLGLVQLSSGFETGTPLAGRLLSIGGGALVLGAWVYILRMALLPLRLTFWRKD